MTPISRGPRSAEIVVDTNLNPMSARNLAYESKKCILISLPRGEAGGQDRATMQGCGMVNSYFLTTPGGVINTRRLWQLVSGEDQCPTWKITQQVMKLLRRASNKNIA